MIRIYVIDDHLLIFDGLCMSFNFGENDIHVVGGSQDVDEALEKIKPDQVDIIILDLFIHNVSPVHNIRRLKRSFPSTPVVVLSQECSLFWQITMFINGAVAYCSKCDGLAKITETLERVYKGEKIIPQEVVKVIIPDNGCYVTEALARLSLGKEGKALVEDLMSSTKNSVQIVNRKGAVNGADTEKGEYIIWDSQNTNGGPDQAGNATRESFIGLGHEMSHVQDIWNGTINNETWQRVTDAKGNPVEIPYAEIYATHKENQVRAENGVPLRVSYAKDTNNNPDPSTRIIRAGTSESIYYQQNGTTRYSPLKKDQVPYKY